MATKDIKQTLKEGTKDLLSEEVLGEIETAFNEAVEERASLQIEAALAHQDEDHAVKVQHLLQAIDQDHSAKLARICEAIDQNHTSKLAAVATRYQSALTEEASGLKDSLVDTMSNYLDLYIEQVFPADMLEEAIKNKRALSVLEDVRQLLGVDMALARESIKEAVLDGKQQIQESRGHVEAVVSENAQLHHELTTIKSNLTLNEKCHGLHPDKQKYMKKVLCDKDPQFITENFDYTLALFDRAQEDQLQELRTEAQQSVRGQIDPVVEQPDELLTESPIQQEDEHPILNEYMGELGKY